MGLGGIERALVRAVCGYLLERQMEGGKKNPGLSSEERDFARIALRISCDRCEHGLCAWENCLECGRGYERVKQEIGD